jgi:hypothetical protein
MDSLRQKVAFLSNHIAIVRFLTRLAPETRHCDWILELERLLGERVEFHKDAGNGFFYLKLETPALLHSLVGLTPCKLSVGVAMVHIWIPAFNPLEPIGLASPTWITFRNLPLEYLPNTRNVAESVGTVLEASQIHSGSRDPRFCIMEKIPGKRIRRLKIAGVGQNFIEIAITYDGETLSKMAPPALNQEYQHWQASPANQDRTHRSRHYHQGGGNNQDVSP